MKKHTLTSLAIDAVGLSLALGSALLFFGYFWPELTGWVNLIPMTGPITGRVLPFVCVVGIITGVGLLRQADWARQIGSAVAPVSGLVFLAVAGLQILYAEDLMPVSLTARCVVCVVGAMYFIVLGGILLCSEKTEEEAPADPLATAQVAAEKTEKRPAPARSPTVAAVLSLLIGILAVAAAVCIAHDPKEGLRWAPAIPFLMLMNVVGSGLGWGGFTQAEDESRTRLIAMTGTILNLLPALATVILVGLK